MFLFLFIASACGGGADDEADRAATTPDAAADASAATAPDAGTAATCPPGEAQQRTSQLLLGSCSGCHGQNQPAGNLRLASAPDLQALIGKASQCSGKVLVTRGNPAASYLLQKLSPNPACGQIMPPSGDVGAVARDCVSQWISGL
jgi:mono/diheme cytochrome c family protein